MLATQFTSKLPQVGTTIFTVMSALAHQHQAINLSQGFPDFAGDPALIDLVYKYMREGMNQYAPMPGLPALRERIAEKVQRLYGRTIDPDHEVTITAGATQALFTAISAVVHSGDEVIIVEPAYDSYRPAIELCGGVPIIYELQAPDYKINWYAFERLITPRTRLIILNTPQNPIGKVLDAADMLALSWLLENTSILLLSDEVYEHLVFDGRLHESALKYDTLYERSLITYSFGKTYHHTGWKIGYCIAPAWLTQEFRKVHQFNVFSVNTPMQYALAAYMASPTTYEGLAAFYQAKRDRLLAAMSELPLRPLTCEGTYFQLFDYSELSALDDVAFAKHLTTAFGVATIPISVFYSSRRDDRVLRFCFAKKEETLLAAAERLAALTG